MQIQQVPENTLETAMQAHIVDEMYLEYNEHSLGVLNKLSSIAKCMQKNIAFLGVGTDHWALLYMGKH